VKKVGGGEAAFVKLASAHYNAAIAKTSCKSGYVAPGCKEYHGPPSVEPSPSVILEGFVKGRAGLVAGQRMKER
jgi:hypothetical protein